jgi:tRNA threonylcarbamoyladenosine biosynthesis protein TsaE
LGGAPAESVIVALRGELGAGKTTFVAGVLEAFGVVGAVRSPTYTLVEPYEYGGRLIYHIDLYRLVDPGEVEMLGVRDFLLSDAVLLIEWPERAGSVVPTADLTMIIRYSDAEGLTARELTFAAGTATGKRILSRLRAAALPKE